MIVVGSPLLEIGPAGRRAGGPAAAIARAARVGGADVQVVGKVGEDPNGDAVLLDLAAVGIGHVAILRDPSRPTGEVGTSADTDPEPFDAPFEEHTDPAVRDTAPATAASAPPPLDPEDLELALRYLTDYRVIVVAEPLPDASLDVVGRAASWANAALVVVTGAEAVPSAHLPLDATVFEAPPADPDGAFAGVVGAYAAAIDKGATPAEAFDGVAESAGWARAAPATD